MSCQSSCTCSDNYDDVTKIVAPKSLEELLEQIDTVFSKDHVNVEYVTALMEAYRSNAADWKKYVLMDEHK